MHTKPPKAGTPEQQARYWAAYNATLTLWPQPVETFTVPTRFGRTHLNACGPTTAPPLVLVPGQAASSTMWYPNLGTLSQHFRIYAPDIPGDVGRSECTQRMTQPADFGVWLSEVFDGLQLADAYVAGLSFGGFIALRFGLAAPARVRALVPMAPAGLLAFKPQYFLRMGAALLPFLSLPTKQKIVLGHYTPTVEPVIKQLFSVPDYSYMYLPPICTDAELRTLRVPTLLLMGEHEVIFDPRAVLARATALIPNLQTALIANAGHALTFDQPEAVNARMLAFFGAQKN